MTFKFRPNYIVIPLITILVALIGGFFTSQGMPWYDAELIRPSLTPPKWVFPVAWNTIFILTTISALILWNKTKPKNGLFSLLFGKKTKQLHRWIAILFIANAFLNIFWSYLFFYLRRPDLALFELILLETTTICLIFLSWHKSKIASLALLPYAVWVAFAGYLNYLIVAIN